MNNGYLCFIPLFWETERNAELRLACNFVWMWMKKFIQMKRLTGRNSNRYPNVCPPVASTRSESQQNSKDLCLLVFKTYQYTFLMWIQWKGKTLAFNWSFSSTAKIVAHYLTAVRTDSYSLYYRSNYCYI